jgi:hypothetical protein
MKSIKQQYIDLQEGNMSQANFMRNLRMTLPQYVTNVTSFNDSIKILKNKGILTEVINPSELAMGIKVEMEHTDDMAVAKKIAMDHLAENPNYYSDLKSSGVDTAQGLKSTIDNSDANFNKANPKDGFSLGFFEGEDNDKISKYESYTYTLNGKVVKPEIAFYNNILKAEVDGELYRIGQPVNDKIELSPIKGKTGTYTESYFDSDPTDGDRDFDMEQRMQAEDLYDKGEQAYLEGDLSKAERYYQAALKAGSWLGWSKNDLPPYDSIKESLKEAKELKGSNSKDLYARFKEIDNLNGHEVVQGIDWEMCRNEELTKEDAIKIVIKNLKKNPIYYTAWDMSGIEGYEPETMGPKADIEARKMQYLDKNMSNVVDKKMGMKPVKGIEKAKKDSDTATAQKYKTSGIDLMSLIAKTVRGVQKMDATGEKMKKVSVKENKVANTIFDRNANTIAGTNAIAKGEDYVSKYNAKAQAADAEQAKKDAEKNKKDTETQLKAAKGDTMDMAISSFPGLRERLKELIRKELKEITGAYGGDAMNPEDGSSYMNEVDIYGIAGNPEEEKLRRGSIIKKSEYEPINPTLAKATEENEKLDMMLNQDIDVIVRRVERNPDLGLKLLGRARKTKPSFVSALKTALGYK